MNESEAGCLSTGRDDESGVLNRTVTPGADTSKQLVDVDDPRPCFRWRRAARQRVEAGPLDSKLGLVARRVNKFQLDLIADGDLACQHLLAPPALDQLVVLPRPCHLNVGSQESRLCTNISPM